jgi:hypothetical protein
VYIQTAEALVWLVLVSVALAAGWGIVSAARARARRRARFMYYLRATQEPERTSSAPIPLSEGLTPEQAEAIRAHAERTATRHWNAGQRDELPVNPYVPGTPEHVLWYASYELKLHDLVDAASSDVVKPRDR